jgi:hypothetical protein
MRIAIRAAMCGLVLVVIAALAILPGCGSVYLQGEALTAAEKSTMDAYGAISRASRAAAAASQPAGEPAKEPAGQPAWMASYLEENFKQWRSFVRAARKDLNWGPRLAGE